MKTKYFLIIVTLAVFFAGCATLPPKELVSARQAYQTASEGPAAKLAPAELHKAQEALNLAEQSFRKDADSARTIDLAYVAQRRAQLAGAVGAMAADTSRKDRADADLQRKQGEIIRQGRQDVRDAENQTAAARAEIDKQAALKEAKDKSDAEYRMKRDEMAQQSRQDLSDSRERTAQARNELASQQAATAEKARQDVIDADQRTADALAELARLADVKEEERGLVVTLSGAVLFRSAESTLLPMAQTKLDDVAKALMAVRERNIIVEGHTDSRGAESYNQGLSERRADTVRNYIVQKGYPADRIQSRGMGEGSPIANNTSPEGRANNRRVEIVIEREMQSSSR
jgi:outer membrane protein OmpA-like peptidoglycan-associated protein